MFIVGILYIYARQRQIPETIPETPPLWFSASYVKTFSLLAIQTTEIAFHIYITHAALCIELPLQTYSDCEQSTPYQFPNAPRAIHGQTLADRINKGLQTMC